MNEETQSVGLAAQIAGVFLAGGVGATLRVLLAAKVEDVLTDKLPFVGVLVCNLIGCLVIGFASAAISTPHWRQIVLGGLLGGFTTYSAFALFSVSLIGEGRSGALAVQLGLHLVGGVACVWIGMWLARSAGLVAAT